MKKGRKKTYLLVEFPYPSGDGLHVGHVRSYTAMDIVARKRRMQGEEVIYPMGWDAFGLPAENYAIKTGIHPAITTKKNINTFRRQMKALNLSFDWKREVNTTDPNYYKWTQWLFLQFYKEGLAYKSKSQINWCPKDKIGLANEEAIGGVCERCGTKTEKREKEQWMLAITKYADRLDADLDLVDYPEPVKLQQRNWIGKSEGWEIDFDDIKVFTTRPDTIFGATFVAVAPELAKKLTGKDFGIKIDNDRENKEKIGADTGLRVKNPASGEMVPVWAVNYVSADYGTGAIMGVPAHDERDFDFAKKYNLPVEDKPLVSDDEVAEKMGAIKKTVYKLRDWVFSRQRYWGEPIPMIYCDKCHWQPVPEKDLPVRLPKVKKYQPTDNGESPLANIKSFVEVKCPKCGGRARRETDTMPNWAGSSWHYLRYADPKNKKEFASKKNLEHWLPVNWYNGGMEHTTLHLLYSRFWHKFLHDQKLVPGKEPYAKRTSHGLVLASDGEKMSKSRGNVINPDEIVKMYGADALRLYEMFMGPFEQAVSWQTESIVGVKRFLERIAKLNSKFGKRNSKQRQTKVTKLEILINQTVKKVSDDIEAMRFNTAVSALMIALNELEKAEQIPAKVWETFLTLLSPFAPHLTTKLKAGKKWPIYDPKLISEEKKKLAVQINGKARGVLEVTGAETEAEVFQLAEQNPLLAKWFTGKEIKKKIYQTGKFINLIV